MKLKLLPVILMLVLAAVVAAMGRKEAPERGPDPKPVAAQPQGIAGKVEIWEGNFMPPVDPQSTRNRITPGADRRVRAHEPVTMAGGMAAPKRKTVETPLVAEAVTDSAGRFFLPTPPGTYSVFVEEDSGWYFNGWNGEGIQGAATVTAGDTVELLIKVTTKATF